ncbi:Hypp4614 [Branchiostoma lanceolatum]|uniref:Hypp4614 protein n=1 Tax=Branchiostoma lanceolatum TaxID=7740 RepID=A0A8K0A8H8_BRALA|nr:Hypp4614 [Branchiostoma lanceolatum]
MPSRPGCPASEASLPQTPEEDSGVRNHDHQGQCRYGSDADTVQVFWVCNIPGPNVCRATKRVVQEASFDVTRIG